MEYTKEDLKQKIIDYMKASGPSQKDEYKGRIKVIVAGMNSDDIESVYKELQLQYIYTDKKDLWYDICVYNPKWVEHMLSGMRSGGSTTCVIGGQDMGKESASYKQLLNIMIAAKAKEDNPLRKALETMQSIDKVAGNIEFGGSRAWDGTSERKFLESLFSPKADEQNKWIDQYINKIEGLVNINNGSETASLAKTVEPMQTAIIQNLEQLRELLRTLKSENLKLKENPVSAFEDWVKVVGGWAMLNEDALLTNMTQTVNPDEIEQQTEFKIKDSEMTIVKATYGPKVSYGISGHEIAYEGGLSTNVSEWDAYDVTIENDVIIKVACASKEVDVIPATIYSAVITKGLKLSDNLETDFKKKEGFPVAMSGTAEMGMVKLAITGFEARYTDSHIRTLLHYWVTQSDDPNEDTRNYFHKEIEAACKVRSEEAVNSIMEQQYQKYYSKNKELKKKYEKYIGESHDNKRRKGIYNEELNKKEIVKKYTGLKLRDLKSDLDTQIEDLNRGNLIIVEGIESEGDDASMLSTHIADGELEKKKARKNVCNDLESKKTEEGNPLVGKLADTLKKKGLDTETCDKIKEDGGGIPQGLASIADHIIDLEVALQGKMAFDGGSTGSSKTKLCITKVKGGSIELRIETERYLLDGNMQECRAISCNVNLRMDYNKEKNSFTYIVTDVPKLEGKGFLFSQKNEQTEVDNDKIKIAYDSIQRNFMLSRKQEREINKNLPKDPTYPENIVIVRTLDYFWPLHYFKIYDKLLHQLGWLTGFFKGEPDKDLIDAFRDMLECPDSNAIHPYTKGKLAGAGIEIGGKVSKAVFNQMEGRDLVNLLTKCKCGNLNKMQKSKAYDALDATLLTYNEPQEKVKSGLIALINIGYEKEHIPENISVSLQSAYNKLTKQEQEDLLKSIKETYGENAHASISILKDHSSNKVPLMVAVPSIGSESSRMDGNKQEKRFFKEGSRQLKLNATNLLFGRRTFRSPRRQNNRRWLLYTRISKR